MRKPMREAECREEVLPLEDVQIRSHGVHVAVELGRQADVDGQLVQQEVNQVRGVSQAGPLLDQLGHFPTGDGNQALDERLRFVVACFARFLGF